jgi:signal transduction histidine kinase
LRYDVGALARADRRSPVAAGFALASGLAIGLVWAFVCPWLAGIDGNPVALLRLVIALAAGGGAALLAPRGVLGSAGSARLTVTIAVTGTLAAIVGAIACVREIDSTPALALGLSQAGVTIVFALCAGAGAFAVDRKQHPVADLVDAPGVPLRALVAGVCGALAVGAWALASAYVLGQRDRDASLHAVHEARDLVAIAAERLLAAPRRAGDIDSMAAMLAPSGGYLVAVDPAGRVGSGVGVGVAPGSTVTIIEGPPTTCRVLRRDVPCAVRQLDEQTRLVAAAPAQPVHGNVIIAFLLAGLAVAASALAIGGLIGAASARDLDRVTRAVDDVRRSAKGSRLDLDKPIVVGSLDEVGHLAAALGRLRAHLQPMILDYRSALERATSADKARDEFLQLVSIELRGPLDKIISGAQILIADTADPLTLEQREDVKTVLAASRHLTELIDEVLDISAIATGQITLRLAPVDLGQLVSDVAKIQRPIVQKKGVEVKVAIDQPSPVVRADERRLRQVMTNIVSNAVKFTDSGSIEIIVKVDDKLVGVSVKDTGPGIAAEALPKLFREFVQLGSLKQRAHGTGLGLAICKRLVEAHGGEVSAESQVGVGSTFRVKLPIAGPLHQQHSTDDTPVQAVNG